MFVCYDLRRGAPQPKVVGRLHTDVSIHRLQSKTWFPVQQSIALHNKHSNKEARLMMSEKPENSRAFVMKFLYIAMSSPIMKAGQAFCFMLGVCFPLSSLVLSTDILNSVMTDCRATL